MPNVDAWGRQVVGQKIDMDGVYGAQCWDLVAHWLTLCGVPLAQTYTASTGSLVGLAGSLVANFPARVGIDQHVDLVPAGGPFQAGDVLVWGRCPAFPDSHTAVARGPAAHGMVPVVTQNDGSAASATGATRYGSLTTSGLIGALRPKTLTPPPTPRKDDDMARILNMRETANGKTNTPTIFFDRGNNGGITGIESEKDLALLKRYVDDNPGDRMYPAELARINYYLKKPALK